MNNEYFIKRRSVRSFQKKEISEEKLNEILFKAAKAPTTGNMQLYSVIITRDETKKAELARFHYNQPATQAPVLLTICADFARFTRWCEISRANAGYDNFLSFLTALEDAMIFTQQIVTIAEMEGLGTCYLGTVLYNAPEIAELLKCPRLVVPVACLAVGYPAEDGVETERLDIHSIIHKEEYRSDSDEEIKEIFKVKDDYPTNKKFVAENGKENLAQVFAEIRYPKNVNEEISAKLEDWLKNR